MKLEFDKTKLKQLRKAKKLRQEDLGKAIDKTGSHISNYETGASLPTVSGLLSLMCFFDIKAQDIGKQENV